MIWIRKFVRSVFLVLAYLLSFKPSPASFYVRDQRLLEGIVRSYGEAKQVVLAKKGFYFFTGNDMTIYSHHQNQSARINSAYSRWIKVKNIDSDTQRLMGFSPEDGGDFISFLRNYLDDREVQESTYLTLYYCSDVGGILFPSIAKTLSFRTTLWTHEMCIE